MNIRPTSAANASSVNLVKYLYATFSKDVYHNAMVDSDLTIAEPSTATITMQNKADHKPIQSRIVK